ncbi:MAG TPA: polyprenyl synthetase family protein, partial [Actinomycetota bacterium]|nr:polyprenyl synthetase family protein [Actinomycetota bacterium]
LIQAGGKRLRPALVMLAADFGEPQGSTDLAAAAVELVHLATLYHDDVIDQTEVRRGVPTVSARWGLEVAVLVGDYLFARACTLGADAGGEVPKILAEAIARVCEGQIAETATVGRVDRSIDEYLATIKKKTAALFRGACELGASTSGASPSNRAALVEYGETLGVAFQVVDDLLDLLGSPEVIGKEPGTDLKEGVFTLPVLMGCARDPRFAELLEHERSIDRILPELQANGAIEAALSFTHETADRARAAIDKLDDSRAKETLATVISGVVAQVPVAV